MNITRNSLLSFSCGIAALVAALSPSSAATILFSDNFTGVAASSLDNNTSAGLNSIGWYFISNSASGKVLTTATDNTSPLSGTVMSNPGGTSGGTGAYKQFSSTNLENPGDYISLSFDLRTPASLVGSISVSLLGYSNTIESNSFATGASTLTGANGYRVTLPISSSSSSPTYYEIVNNGTGGTLFTPTEGISLSGTNAHTMTLTLTRMVAGIQIAFALDTVEFSSFTDTSGDIYSTFNTLRISTSRDSGGSQFNFDNVIVTTSVPEPGSLAMIGLSGCLLVAFRMRRKIDRRAAQQAVFAVAFFMVAATGAFAGEKLEITGTPVSDGDLSSKSWADGPVSIEDSKKTARIGSSFKVLCVGIFEFALPPVDQLPDKALRSAKLIFYANAYKRGERGVFADEDATANVDVDVYGYTDENADGIVTESDWSAGQKLGRWLTQSETLTGRGTPMPGFEVTEYVLRVFQENKRFVGFRLQPENVSPEESANIVLRTAEFGGANAPKLVLEFEKYGPWQGDRVETH